MKLNISHDNNLPPRTKKYFHKKYIYKHKNAVYVTVFVSLCSIDYSYLRISNEKSQSFGVYCGNASMHTGKEVIVTGTCAVITFHAGNGLQGQGFFLILILTTVDQSKCNNYTWLYFFGKLPRHISGDWLSHGFVGLTSHLLITNSKTRIL